MNEATVDATEHGVPPPTRDLLEEGQDLGQTSSSGSCPAVTDPPLAAADPGRPGSESLAKLQWKGLPSPGCTDLGTCLPSSLGGVS